MHCYITDDLVMYYIVQFYYYHICYTSSTTLYTDISTVVFSHIVLNDGQWSVGFVLDSNDLTLTNKYQQRVLKRFVEVRKEWIEQSQDNSLTKKAPSYKNDLLVVQQNIKSLKRDYQNQKMNKVGWMDGQMNATCGLMKNDQMNKKNGWK